MTLGRSARIAGRILAVGVATLIVVAAFAAAAFRWDHGVWPTQVAHPWHVRVCGREYQDTGLVVSKAAAMSSLADVGPLERIGTFAPPLSFTPVWAVTAPSHTTTPCGMTVYLEQPSGALETYVLEGGP